MIRDILNANNEVIGQLTLPDDTPEEIWQEKLAEYLPKPPAVVAPIDQVKLNMKFGRLLIAEFGSEEEPNLLDTDQTAALIGMLGPVQMMLMTGAIATAMAYLQNMDFTGVLSQELINLYVAKMQSYLGV